ncbi:MAG: ribonuclease HII [bacterium]|nr:ribonuclease HII [bacterium]MDZ4296335.1 ribonuclease HII [Patescibacteria group bacterium]
MQAVLSFVRQFRILRFEICVTLMQLPSKLIERTLFRRGVRWIAAVDEAGRGAWAGPVVAAAVLFDAAAFHDAAKRFCGVADSKLLSPAMRTAAFEVMTTSRCLRYAVGQSTAATIDRINIRQAAFLAMARAVGNLPQRPDVILVDGIDPVRGIEMIQQCFAHGDRRIFSIAAASIIAKVTRDRLMDALAQDYPRYGFEKHKGYGTALHQARLAAFGPSPIHRRSYAPVAGLLYDQLRVKI